VGTERPRESGKDEMIILKFIYMGCSVLLREALIHFSFKGSVAALCLCKQAALNICSCHNIQYMSLFRISLLKGHIG